MLRPGSDRWRGVFDALPRIAAGTDAFFAEPDAAVRRIQPGEDWKRYAAQAKRIQAETDQFFAALDPVAGSDSDRVRRDRTAAVEAFEWFDAESAARRADGRPPVEALVATRGDRLIAVTVFRETDDALEVLAEGNTRPPGPDGLSAELALQYALARSAAYGGYEVRSHLRATEQDRAGQQVREATLGRTRDDSGPGATYSWSAAEARLVARDLAHPGDTDRLPELTIRNGRYWEYAAGQISNYHETGGRVRVVRHSTPADRMPEGLDGQSVVELARLSAVQHDYTTADAPFSPSGDHARDLVTLIAEHEGNTVATLTYGDGDGTLRVVQETGAFETDPGAVHALRAGLMAEAARRGFSVTYQLADGAGTVSAYSAGQESAQLRAVLGERYSMVAPPRRPDVRGAEQSEVVQRVSNFDRQQGDVVVLSPGSERLAELRDQISGRLADNGQPTPPYLAQALAQAMPEQSITRQTKVAVAMRDGEPTAVVRYHHRLHYVELDAAASVPGHGTPADVAAALVEGPMRSAPGRPLTGAVPPELGRLYTAAGADLVERGPLDSVPGLVTAGIEGPAAANLVRAVDAERDLRGRLPAAIDLDLIAGQIRTFDRLQSELVVLDHSDPEDRRRADLVHRLHPHHATDREFPGDDRDRFTVVAVEDGSALAFMTVDATPKEPFTVIAAGDSVKDPPQPAIQWWLANHAVAHDRHVVLTDPVNRYLAGSSADQRTAHWTPPEMKQTILGVHNRTGGRHDALLAGAGEARPRANPDSLPLPETPTAAEEGETVKVTGRARWEPRNQPGRRSANLQRGG